MVQQDRPTRLADSYFRHLPRRVRHFHARVVPPRAVSLMAIPEPIEPQRLADYLAVMSRAVFQAGLSWKMIEARWNDYLRLFEGFDPVVVAAFDSTDGERILNDGRVVRVYKKVGATIENAKILLALDREHGGFRNYLRSFDSYEALAKDL